MRLVFILALTWSLANAQEDPPEAQGIPCWILIGLAKVETQSFWDDAGRFHYIDQRDGKDGEKGSFQITPEAFRQVAKKGERFVRLTTDQRLSLAVACRYLRFLRARTRSWDQTVACFNTGLGGSPSKGAQYLMLVKLAAGIR